jgi:hypothetical protein
MTEQYQAQIAALAAFPAQLAALVDGLSAEQLTTAYLHGEWTVAQNVHHVADSHITSYHRCRLIVSEHEPPLKAYDQDALALLPDAADADISHSLALLQHLHARWVQFWRQLPEDAWQRAGIHQHSGRVTLAEMLTIYVAHGEAHLDQIRRTLAAR